MKVVKNILIGLVALVVLILVIGLFVNSDYAVERQVTVNQPKDSVFAYVKLLKNQDQFSVWANMDPEMKKTFSGQDGTVGFVSAWDSDNPDVGRGEQEIMKITEGERIDYELRFKEPFEATDNAYLTTMAVNDSVTTVAWGFNGHMDYPMNLMLLFMDMEEMLGGDLQKGLDNLKDVLEK